MNRPGPVAPGQPRDAATRREHRWALAVSACVMALTMVPYLYGLTLQGSAPGREWFAWLGNNLSDGCVYLSWMRQAADGSFFQRNLFTTEPQAGRQVNVFFLLLGNISRVTGLPLLFTFHAARLAAGVALLRCVWWMLESLLADRRARRASLLLVGLSAGIGWVPGLWRRSGIESPVDVWQPEAVTFLALYLNPLFIASLILMLGALGWLWRAERSGRMRHAVYAGLCGLVLGNIHTYDVITVGLVWGATLLVQAAARRRWDWSPWVRAAIAGAVASPSVAYTITLHQTEGVFAKRVAVPTLSSSPGWLLAGFGLVLVLALVTACLLFMNRLPSAAGGSESREAVRFLVVWALVNAAASYLPVAFQRKMLMGAQIPLAILAGTALWILLRRLRGPTWALALGVAVLLLIPSNLRFMAADMEYFHRNWDRSLPQRPFMHAGEVAALDWLRRNTPPGVPVQPLPWIGVTADGKAAFFDVTAACFAPGLTGRPVHAGHWGETPRFKDAMSDWANFLHPMTTPEWRREFLRRTGVRFVILTRSLPDESAGPAAASVLVPFSEDNPPPYLRPVPEASSPGIEVYEVSEQAGRDR